MNSHSNELEFLRYMLQHRSAVSGVHRNNVHPVLTALPPKQEQGLVADFLDEANTRLAATTSKLFEPGAKRREYRTALISAAVTGRIDVTHS